MRVPENENTIYQTTMKNHTMKTLMPMRMALSAAVLSMLAIGGAKGANTLYAPGDLVLYFQQQGGANTVYVNVGNAATNFRGAAAGAADGGYNLNFINISTTLESAFGPNWASSSTVYAGMAGVWGGEPDDETLQNGDPSRTLYVSKARTSVGTVGVAGSSGWTVNTNTGMTNGAAGIYNQNNVFEQNYDVSATVSLAAISRIDENNPFTTAGSITIQGTAFNIFGGGVQQQGAAGSFGNVWGAGDVEFALDLYRITATNSIAGQVPGILRQGSYEGTMTVNSSGDVSFVAVPEPSALALTGLAACTLLIRRRRTA